MFDKLKKSVKDFNFNKLSITNTHRTQKQTNDSKSNVNKIVEYQSYIETIKEIIHVLQSIDSDEYKDTVEYITYESNVVFSLNRKITEFEDKIKEILFEEFKKEKDDK